MIKFDRVVTLPNGLSICYRYPADKYVVGENKVIPPYFRHGDLLQDDVLLDIGAHIGIVAAQASTLCREVIAIEAEQENFAFLCANCAAIDNVTLKHGFVSCASDVGDATLYIGDNDLSGHSGFVRGRHRSRSQVVNRIYISQLLDTYMPDFVKLDCEGSEWYLYTDILDHRKTPQVISMEVHLGKKEWRNSYPVMLQDLLDEGYVVIAPEDIGRNWHVMVHASRRL